VAELDEAAGILRYRAADGLGAEAVIGLEITSDQGLAGYVASSGHAIAVDTASDDPRFARDIAERTGHVPDRVLAVPIVAASGEVLGVLSMLDYRDDGAGNRELLDLATAFAAQAALGVRVATAVERLGAVLLRATADAADDESLAAALRRRASSAKGRDADLARLAARIGELQSLAPAMAATVGRIIDELVEYTRSSRGRRR
jgi:signal transduction protein with GAF and PtsI domain